MIENYYRNENYINQEYMELFQHADADTIIKALENDILLAEKVGYTLSLNGGAKMMVTSPLMIMCYRNDVEHTKLLNVIKLLIDNGADINFLNSSPLRNACSHVNIKVVTLLLEQKALLEYEAKNYHNRYYQPSGSILYDVCKSAYEPKSLGFVVPKTKNGFIDFREEENQKSEIIQKEKEIIKLLVKNGANVNFTYSDNSPFKYAYDNNDKEIVELFLKKGADEDTKYDNQITFLEHARVYKKEKKWFLDLFRLEHNPKELSEALSKFSKGFLMYTNHDLDINLEYNNFINNLQNEWNEIKEILKISSKHLHDNIEKFLFEEKLGQNDEKGNEINWGEKITIGFSSPEIKEWMEKGKQPKEYPLPKGKRTKELRTFKDIMDKFKSLIVVKDNNLFYYENLENNYKDLKFMGKFFTDVERLKEVINIIFNDIYEIETKKEKDDKKTTQVKITIGNFKEKEDDIIEFRIIHIGSNSPNTSKELLEAINENSKHANFKEIYKKLTSLCHWSIETICSDKNRYHIDYLYPKQDENKPHCVPIGDTDEGFTHILRFY